MTSARTRVLRRWLRRLAIGALTSIALLLIGWRVALAIVERAPARVPLESAVCAGMIDTTYLDAVERARRHLQVMRVERAVPGVTAAVAVAGRLVWSEGFGYADLDRNIVACPRMLFRTQSVSKLFTVAARARLAQRGDLDLDTDGRGAISAELLHREVFEPLGLYRTGMERSDIALSDVVTFYDNVTPDSLDGSIRVSPLLDFSSKWGSGGILSTVEDLVRFGSAHIEPNNNGFLSDEMLGQLFTPRTSRSPPTGLAPGWVLVRDHHGRHVRLHFGAGSGGTSFLAVYPDQQVVIAVLANLGYARFPMARMDGAISGFVDDPFVTHTWLIAAGALGMALLLRLRRPRAPRAE